MKRLALTLLIIIPVRVALAQTPSDMEVIARTSHFILAPGGMTRVDTVLLQINNRNADTEIRIPYSRGDKVNIDRAWIEDATGSVVRALRKNDIRDRSSISSISLYEDDFVKYFDLKHDAFPYRIYYTVRIRYMRSLNTIDINHAWSKTPVRDAKVMVEIPAKDSVRFKHENAGEPGTFFSHGGQFKKYTWQYNYTPPLAWEANALEKDLKAPSIQVVPLYFKFGEEGSFASWQSFGNWVFRLNKNRDKLTPEERGRIDNLLRNVENDRQKAEILYRYLQDHTRYINVSIKLGGLQTHPASYVCDHKYGDCKALTNYMQAMLKYAGISSYYTLIEAGSRAAEIDTGFPSQAFNHVILVLPLENDTVFLECTSKNDPFGYVGTAIQERKALLIDEEKSRIIETPSLQPEDVLCTRTITVHPDRSEILLEETQRGFNYELYTYLDKEVSRNEVADIIRDHIFSGKAELHAYELLPTNREKAEIGLTARFKAENIYREYGNNLILPPFPISIKSYDPPEARSTGVRLDYPEFYVDRVVYNIQGKEIHAVPEEITVESDFGRYEQRYELVEGALVCHKLFLLHAGQYPLERYADFYRFISMARDNETKNIHVETR